MTSQQRPGNTRLLLHIRRLLTGLLLIAAMAAVYFARDFLLPAVFAFFIAVTLRPLVRSLSRRGIPAWATTAVIVIVAGAAHRHRGLRLRGRAACSGSRTRPACSASSWARSPASGPPSKA